MNNRVVNLRREPYDVYIGRAGKGQDGYYGNPHALGMRCRTCSSPGVSVHHDPETCLRLYRDYFADRLRRDPEFAARVEGLRGKTLGCFCKPGPCHGDIIVAYLDGRDAARKQP